MSPVVFLAEGASSDGGGVGGGDDGSSKGHHVVALYTTHDINSGVGSHAVAAVGSVLSRPIASRGVISALVLE
jgi:hypothetical protein